MNIITNNCTGGYLYKDHMHCEFKNPFIWSSIQIDDFCRLINGYSQLNFGNIRCELVTNSDSGIAIRMSRIVRIMIDGTVSVFYFHYIKDEKYAEASRTGNNIFCKDIIRYTKSAYFRRLEKMTEEPLFIWDDTPSYSWYYPGENKDAFSLLKQTRTPYRIIYYGYDVPEDVPENFIVLKKSETVSSVPYLFELLNREKLLQ